MNKKICPICLNHIDEATYQCFKCRMNFNETRFVIDDENLQRKAGEYKNGTKKTLVPTLVMLGVIFLCVALVLMDVFNTMVTFSLIVCVPFLLVVIYLINRKTVSNRLKGQNLIINAVLGKLFDRYEYHPNGNIMPGMLRELNLAEKWNNSTGNLLTPPICTHEIKSQHNGIPFLFSQLFLERRSGKRSSIIFLGPWISLEMGKTVSKPVLISSISSDLKWAFSNSNTVLTEDLTFNRHFNIFTSEGITAFKILTPAMMELLLTSGNVMGNPVHLLFTGRRVHVLIETKQLVFNIFGYQEEAITGIPLMQRNITFSVEPLERQVRFMQSIIDLLRNNRYFFDNI